MRILDNLKSLLYLCTQFNNIISLMQNNGIVFSDSLDSLLSQHKQIQDSLLIIICTAGKLQIEINERQYFLSAHDMLLCSPKQIVGNYMYSPDMRCRVIAVNRYALDDIIYICTREDHKWWEKYQYLQNNPIIHLNSRQQELAQLFIRLFALYNEDLSGLSLKIQHVFAQAAVYELLIWLEGSIHDKNIPYRFGRQEVLFRKFIHLADEQAGRQREIKWYADHLSVSAKYLSGACNAIAKKSPSSIIQDITIREIKRLLQQTDLSIKEISIQMNFVSLSFFCKYVKQHIGVSAVEFRNHVQNK